MAVEQVDGVHDVVVPDEHAVDIAREDTLGLDGRQRPLDGKRETEILLVPCGAPNCPATPKTQMLKIWRSAATGPPTT
jgi:hypothetical protein